MISSAALIAKFQEALNDKYGYIYGKTHDLWSAAKQKAYNEEKKDDSNCQNSIKYGSKWYGHYVTDCSGLFAWAFKQLGSQMYHGSNTMYLKWCVNKGQLKSGKRTDGATLKPGTAVFVWNGKTYSHVGLFIGNGDVIEAAGARQGVITSKVTESKWAYWGELKDVSFDVPVDTGGDTGFPDHSVWHPTVRKGSKGDDVKYVQTILYNLGYNLGSYGIDGDFGSATQAAVKEFQRDHNLNADGVVGPLTYDALEKAANTINPKPADKTYTVSIRGLSKAQADAITSNYPGATVTEE